MLHVIGNEKNVCMSWENGSLFIYVHFNMAAFYHYYILHNFFKCFFVLTDRKNGKMLDWNGVCVCVCQGGRVCVACIYYFYWFFFFQSLKINASETDIFRSGGAIFLVLFGRALFACWNRIECVECNTTFSRRWCYNLNNSEWRVTPSSLELDCKLVWCKKCRTIHSIRI